jgi:hypothetical protein
MILSSTTIPGDLLPGRVGRLATINGWIYQMDTNQSRKTFLLVVAIVGLGLLQSA